MWYLLISTTADPVPLIDRSRIFPSKSYSQRAFTSEKNDPKCIDFASKSHLRKYVVEITQEKNNSYSNVSSFPRGKPLISQFLSFCSTWTGPVPELIVASTTLAGFKLGILKSLRIGRPNWDKPFWAAFKRHSFRSGCLRLHFWKLGAKRILNGFVVL